MRYITFFNDICRCNCRILLAYLYAEPAFYQRDKLKRMIQTVSEKEPKVQSTTIKQMRRKATELLKKHSEISSEASRRAQ